MIRPFPIVRLFLAFQCLAVVSAFAEPPSASSAVPAEVPSAEELDRPGEVENPFTLPAGTAQIVSYVLAANPQGREDEELGNGGSATLLQAGVRFGLRSNWEGQIFADTYLQAIDKGNDGDDPGRSQAGIGAITLRAKFQVVGDGTGEGGIALVPFVRLPLSQALTGQTGVGPGLILPFDADLEHGWEIEGSTGVTRIHDDESGWTSEWETQASLEWHFMPRWSVYVEPQLDLGEGRPQWSIEQGVTCVLARRLQVDLGVNTGFGRNSRAHFAYLGFGWTL